MKYRITIEFLNEPGEPPNAPFSTIVDNLEIRQDGGIAFEGPRPVPNGQSRILIKGWTGCTSYDNFTTEWSKPNA